MMISRSLVPLVCALPFVLAGCTAEDLRYEPGLSGDAFDAGIPGLPLGTTAPDATLVDTRGSELSLASLYRDGPTILVFYRGGWCRYCNQTLSDWASRATEARRLGAQIIAISPESPDNAEDTENGLSGPIQIYSDAYHDAAIGFKVSRSLGVVDRTGYSLGGIDLGKWNASGEWELPAGATFVIDRSGIIRYRFADWDHTVRADPSDVLRAVRDLQQEVADSN